MHNWIGVYTKSNLDIVFRSNHIYFSAPGNDNLFHSQKNRSENGNENQALAASSSIKSAHRKEINVLV